MNRIDLQYLAETRLREARVLLGADQYSGAYYLAGYSVECALKACIAKSVQQHDFPDKDRVRDSYIHNLPKLANVAYVSAELVIAIAENAKLEAAWTLVATWDEASRYKLWTKDQAEAMIEAVGADKDGVLPWIMQRW